MVKKIRKKIKHKLIAFFSQRNLVLLVVFGMLSAILAGRLFVLQIVNGQYYTDSFTVKTTATRMIKSSRGNIYDATGKLLAYNKLANNVTMEDNGSYDTTREKNLTLNGEIRQLTQMIRKNGDMLAHDFHIIVGTTGRYTFDTDNEVTLARFRADVYGYATIDELKSDEVYASAEKIMKDLCSEDFFQLTDSEEPITDKEKEKYGLPDDYDKQEALDIVIVRYQLKLVTYQRYMAVTVAQNVSEQTVADVRENQDLLKGVDVTEDYIRVYNSSEALSPILGYTGRPSQEELEKLQSKDKKKNYSSSSVIGKAGIEQYMETTLQGTDGSEEVTVDNLGKVVAENKKSRKEPVKGDDVYLTIDSELQDACYKILEQRIAGVLLKNLTDAKKIDAKVLEDNDTMAVASYDCYNAMIKNNIIDTSRFSAEDATPTEQQMYSSLKQTEEQIFAWFTEQMNSGSPTAYKDLNDAQKSYVDYILDDYLTTNCEILNGNNINTDDSTYLALYKDESISPAEYLRYAANNGWVNVTALPRNKSSYLTSDEIFQAVVKYVTDHIADNRGFEKIVYYYMLMDGVISPSQIMQCLYDQGVLSTDDGVYPNFAAGQMTAYDLMVNKISGLQITPAMLALDPCSGSIVIADPKTGDVKACVTYPGYDNNRLANEMDVEYFNKLNADMSTPFYNKATQQLTAPGSTYKMVMAAAGMDKNVVDEYEGIDCTGIFGKDLEFLSDQDRVHCWNKNGHGMLNVISALENSCNVYFCTVAIRLGEDKKGNYAQARALEQEQKYSAMFGLDKTTGIQTPESEPHVTDDMAIPSSIGQGTHQYTTTQLARYVSAIANRGKVNDFSLVQRVTDSDGKILKKHTTKTVATAKFKDDTWDAIYQGMFNAVSNDQVWSGFDSSITVRAKTGTAQESMLRPDHALAVGFTQSSDGTRKYGDVAFAVRIANGYSSRNASLVARDALNYYFNLKPEEQVLTGAANTEGVLRQVVAD